MPFQKEVKMSRKYLALMGFLAIALLFMSTPAQTETRPIQIALVTPVQIFPEEEPISGIRLNLIYGRNVSVAGLDMGLVNHVTTDISMGLQVGLVGLADSGFVGWQHNYLVNVTQGEFQGFQMGIVNYAKSANGFQLGIVNYAESIKGVQVGVVNIIHRGGAFPVFPIVNWSF
jgi:hypothetical protein